ncbi:MAG: recombinase family protein, partial [Clostridiales bacterium]|nr:recombinase family protein [Clostridiales bacterium]
IMSSIAQEERRKISERVCWGQKRQMEKGVVFGNRIFGYYLKNGCLTPNEAEAKIVRLIFELYLHEGMGSHILARELENRAIPTPGGGARWQNATILKILKNEKYAGVLKQKKYITTDYLTHKKKLNQGEEDHIIIGNHHEPIIDSSTFEQVQQEIEQRKNAAANKSRYSGCYVFSGKIECAQCGTHFKRRIQNRKGKNPQTVWQCTEASRYGKEKTNKQGRKSGCNCQTVKEQVLQDRILAALGEAIGQKEILIAELKKAVRLALTARTDRPDRGLEADMERINKRKQKLLDLYLDENISPKEYRKMTEQFDKQLEIISNNLALLQRTQPGQNSSQERSDVIDQAIESLLSLEIFDDFICKEVLEKVVVQNREKITVFLRNGEKPAIFFYPYR